jgi:GNAT superfamily N-acetyltransferase
MTDDIVFDGYRPGAIGATLALHMAYYGPEWGFGVAFETSLAREIGEFLSRFDATRDLYLAAYDPAGTLLGTITVDGRAADGEGARIRWFVVGGRGRGLGKRLMERATRFLDDHGYARTYLTTFAGLDTARALYERHGFRLAAETGPDPWTGAQRTQRFERRTA